MQGKLFNPKMWVGYQFVGRIDGSVVVSGVVSAAWFVLATHFGSVALSAPGSNSGLAAGPGATSRPVSIAPPTAVQAALLEMYQKRMTRAGQLKAKVTRRTLVGLLGTEKSAQGTLLLSKGRLRIDLKTAETEERQLLVVGTKVFWAATYPPVTLKGAAVQVVTGPVKSKKSGSQGFLALLSKDGFLKSFSITGVALADSGEIRYYLQPKQDWVEAKRALLALVPAKRQGDTAESSFSNAGEWAIGEMKIWDFQDNETTYFLQDVLLEKQTPPDKEFEYKPPKSADVMPVGT